jgi:ABC-type Mn2+/Zn2+ transport system permease subunit
LTRSVAGLLAVSVAIAATQGALGLYVSLWLDVPPGPAVAVVGSSLYAVVALTLAALHPGPVPAAEAT